MENQETPKMIEVRGKEYPYEVVKDSVVKIWNTYFFRDSPEITKVRGRYYRKESPLIRKLYNGRYELKKNTVQIGSVWASNQWDLVVKLDNDKWEFQENCIKIRVGDDVKWYRTTDERLAYCRVSSVLDLKENMIELPGKWYGSNRFVTQRYKTYLKETEDGLCLKGDCTIVYRPNQGKIYAHVKSDLIRDNKFIGVFIYGEDRGWGDIDYYSAPAVKALECDKDDFDYVDHLGVYVTKGKKEEFMSGFKKWHMIKYKDHLDGKKGRLKVSEVDENKAVLINPNYRNLRGRSEGPYQEGRKPFRMSPSRRLTGGIGYTFGVEFEAAMGELPEKVIDNLGLALMGDGSIGAGEYVTGVLHGDRGMKDLNNICKGLSQHLWVDDTCGLHIHVGGGTDSYGNKTDMPVFNRNFSIHAIRLAAQVEDEMFAICPLSRKNDARYCHGIKSFGKINQDNWRDLLGKFVFQEPYAPKGHISGVSKKRQLTRWCEGRYKWLNLVNCNSKSRFETIEFRIFAGTTDIDKVKNYVLICLAFTWFVENKQKRIMEGGVTLKEIVREALTSRRAGEVEQFIDERTAKFGRLNKQQKIVFNAAVDSPGEIQQVMADGREVDAPLEPRVVRVDEGLLAAMRRARREEAGLPVAPDDIDMIF